MKDVEEKRLVTDSKYLALLGLDMEINTTPVTPNQNVTIVSLLRPGSDQQLYGFVKNVSHFLPSYNIVVYSVGLNDEELLNARNICNSSRCSILRFNLSPYPAHAEDERLHVYRPLVIQVIKNYNFCSFSNTFYSSFFNFCLIFINFSSVFLQIIPSFFLTFRPP